jgi:hypothetical protein
MKHLSLILIIFSLNIYLFGQVKNFKEIPKEILEQLDKMGRDDYLSLNHFEGAYFNIIFEKSRKDFDFVEKKIGFITGSSGKIISDKRKYFDLERYRFNHNYSPNGGILYIFNANQKGRSSGYDAVIIYWCKVKIELEDIIERLKKE